MYGWIAQLKPGDRVLDVASGPGSFPNEIFPCLVVWLDEDLDAFRTAAAPPPGPYYRVFGQGERLPFASGSFDLVICHHALEHVADLRATLREVGRVLKPEGRFYVAVPNGYGLCDGIYRFLFEGGGHLQRYRRAELAAVVEEVVGARLTRWRTLYSSFVYIERLRELLDSPHGKLSDRLERIGRLPRGLLTGGQKALWRGTRLCDRVFGTGFSEYGWALYFERSAAPGKPERERGYINVCVRCGAGHPAASLSVSGWRYACPHCQAPNRYVAPFGHTE
jgi:SAM-dependent methyltransferase